MRMILRGDFLGGEPMLQAQGLLSLRKERSRWGCR
jgi:hypothetical protein